MWVLGISCYRDDATAALLHDGAIVGIAEEERFIRVKHAVQEPLGPFVTSLGEMAPLRDFELRYFPQCAVAYLLTEAGIDRHDIDVVAYDFDFNHRIAHWNEFLPVSAHAAGTVFGSGLDDTTFLVMDGLGELESTTMGYFDGEFRIADRVPLPNSLGLFYAAVTRFLGFRPFSEEQKTMGLAGYGDPAVFRMPIGRIIRSTENGFEIDSEVIWTTDVKMDVDRPPLLADVLGVPPRPAELDALEEPYPHVAAAAQEFLEMILNHLVDRLFARVKSRRLCLAGGVALNCAANGTLLRPGRYRIALCAATGRGLRHRSWRGLLYLLHHDGQLARATTTRLLGSWIRQRLCPATARSTRVAVPT
jgi:carbamoyltransferase